MDIKKVLLVKSLRESLYNNYIFPQSQQQTQATDIHEEEIRMGINLPYVKVVSEKLQLILGTHRARFIFDTENTLRKLLCTLKDRVATEDEKKIVLEIDFSNCRVVYFG